jgi:aminopeptidase N
MKWWDDLWLNEAFADFMSYYCIDSIKTLVTTIETYSSGWLGGLARSVGGYREDQMTTTHPIRTPVANTSLATVYFDAITYQKGSMTLKQLMFLMGETAFFQGVTDYLN